MPNLMVNLNVMLYTIQLAHFEYLPSTGAYASEPRTLFVANLHLSHNEPERHVLGLVQIGVLQTTLPSYSTNVQRLTSAATRTDRRLQITLFSTLALPCTSLCDELAASVLHELAYWMEHELASSPSGSSRVGLVLAGDLNHEPNSPLYEFLQKGRLFVPASVAEQPADSFNDSKGWVCSECSI